MRDWCERHAEFIVFPSHLVNINDVPLRYEDYSVWYFSADTFYFSPGPTPIQF